MLHPGKADMDNMSTSGLRGSYFWVEDYCAFNNPWNNDFLLFPSQNEFEYANTKREQILIILLNNNYSRIINPLPLKHNL